MHKGEDMEDIFTIIGSTVLVFTITEFLKWLLRKLKSWRLKKRKEQRRAVLRKEN